ncbi:hypothetical protein Micbo1qcDRAFT_169666 [Microdochium bolleyi]|uniref:ABC-2 type transporter-domain-containing protein n=1 Tax=Microdochium bolleyi TaxID=196109 RepID=A0A136IJG9_9PEZI|nr:hypothetical protein Micbo1qcDRAFT_169666 [Microdochium bolleyi]
MADHRDPEKAQEGISALADSAQIAAAHKHISGKAPTEPPSSSGGADVEKVKSSRTGGDESDSTEELFDLEATLRGGLAAEQEAGIKPKHIGVYWNGLTVKGMGGFSNYVQTFPDVFKNFFDIRSPLRNLVGKGPAFTEATLLDNFKGVVKPGEMVLVLGRPGSGCTTFLKNIANQRAGYTGVSGEVLYGLWTADEFKQYRGEAVYNQEDDIHHSTLSVGQTLGFALDVKVPNKLPAGTTKSQFKEDVISMLLKIFNIEHTRNTVVGDAIVCGVSGGERKRVSIAEMMITNTNLYQTSTFISLYQASENIYKRFDKVLVIDSSKQVYFRPATEARAYFEGLGFLPRPQTLAEAFDKSTVAARLREEIAEYKTESKRGGAKRSVYGVSFYLQIQDKLSLYLSWLRAIIIAIVLGTLYLNLGQTSASAFSKGGLLFISLLFNAFQAFSELGSTMTGRPIIFVNITFSAVQIIVFSIIVYFMTNLTRTAGAFFIYYFLILVGNIAITLFFRIIGYISPDFDYAIKFTIFWINPLGLAFAALMANEFGRSTMIYSSESLVPTGPGYDNINNQVCTIARSTPGTLEINGAIIVFFLIINVLLGEFVKFGASGSTFRTREGKDETSNLNYDIPIPGGTRRLLNSVYGYYKLDVLAARKNIGVIASDILEEKYAYVEEIIALLEMEDIADAIIGYPEAGLVVEQRKRLTIGVELAAKPELLLFLDKPTSGLDSQSAFNIPNAALFENFDRLLLLQRGGQCREFASPKSHQLKTVMYRMNVSLWRSPNYLFTRVFNHVVIALFTSLTYLQLDNSRASLQNKVFVMFQITVLPALVISQAEVIWVIKRAIFFREQSSKIYSTFTFTTTMIVAEIPYSILYAYESSRAGLQFFFMLLTELFAITLGQVLAAISPSAFIACQYDPFIVITFALFCGLDPFTRLIGGTVTTALEGVEVVCGSSYGEYMAPYFSSGGLGYITNNATSAYEFCAYKVGNQFYEPLSFSFDNRWRDLGIYVAFIFSNIAILFLAGRFLNFNRR